jgi:hypothetical protein
MGWVGHSRLPVHPVPERLLTRAELAEEMRVSLATVDRQIAAGLPTLRFSPGRVLIRWNDAVAWCDAQAMRHGKAA